MIHINIANLHILRLCIKTKQNPKKVKEPVCAGMISFLLSPIWHMLFNSKLKPHSWTIRAILPQEVHFALLICSEMTILDWITCQGLSLAKTDPFFPLNSHWLPVALHLEVWTYQSGMSTDVLINQLLFS